MKFLLDKVKELHNDVTFEICCPKCNKILEIEYKKRIIVYHKINNHIIYGFFDKDSNLITLKGSNNMYSPSGFITYHYKNTS